MRRKSLISLAVLAVLAAFQSCGLYEIGEGEPSKPQHGPVWGGVDVEGDTAGGLRSVCYMTAMDYKKDYDWRSDPAVGSVKCSLVVYADGVPVMKVPVGDEYEISSDPDMHRIIGGHLYTDYSTETETVVRKDGSELFRYPGRESISGMEAVGGSVYTLGQNRDGSGFAFRKDGEVILERKNGNLIGSLVNDEDTLCFAFCEEIRNMEGEADRYYAVVNGKVSQVALREDIRKVWDVHVRKDKVVYVASLTGVLYPVVLDGEEMISLVRPLGTQMLSCHLFCSGGKVIVEGAWRYSDGRRASTVWVDGKIVSSVVKDNTISAMHFSGDGIFCAMNPVGKGNVGTIYRDGDVYDMPEGYVVMGSGCISMVDGILHVGLSSTDGGKPVVWKDSLVDTLKINGYISSIYASEAKSRTNLPRSESSIRPD